MKTFLKILVGLVVLAGIAVAAYFVYARATQAEPIALRTASVKRGDLVSIINATGTVEPEEVVDVGAQVVGRIKDLDVAAEMVTFTKNSILQQAGTSILAQANSAPQNILTLLR